VFVHRAIESVVSQSYKVDEIIVVDDGSTDETQAVVQAWGSVRYCYQEHGGVSRARNRGIAEAKNAWIAFLDSDDLWHAQKIEKQVAFHLKNQQTYLSQTKERWLRRGVEVPVAKAYRKPMHVDFEAALHACLITASSLLVHRSVFEKVGLFDETLVVCEDYDMWLRILRLFRVGLVDEVLVDKVAGHGDQLSYRYVAMDIYRIHALLKHRGSPYKEQIDRLIEKKLSIIKKGSIKHNNRFLLHQLDLIYKQLGKRTDF
jgi:glycosyltransferase involved in cell wall biosynthesis